MNQQNNTANEKKTKQAILTMQDGGRIVIQLDPESAPQTCANFVKLVNQGFYNGLIFHRVIP